MSKPLTSQQEIAKIREKLGHLTMEAQPAAWFNTGNPDLNEVLGDRERGIPYGRIMEFSGWESGGKTAVALSIMALAQRDGASAIWGDFETSFDEKWATVRGINVDELRLIQPYVGYFDSEKEVPRLSTAQELCAEIEGAMDAAHRRKQKIFGAIDSVAAMLAGVEAAAGIEGASMRTQQGLPVLMSALLRRWVGLAQAYSATLVFVNQLREKPGFAYGDPAYTPGGNALKFYAHIRVRVQRAKGGKIMRKGKQAGIQGIMVNRKNKCGGLEGSKIGYRILFDGPIEFVPASSLEKE